jgi:ABC-2 type transport system ATP-binding protein
MSLINIHNLSKQFKLKAKSKGFFKPADYTILKALEDINLTIDSGEFVALLGPNGAGKSTLIKIMVGVMTRSGGDLSVFGLDPLENRSEIISKIGLVFGQRSRLWYDLPVSDSFELTKKMYKVKDDSDYKDWKRYLFEQVDILDILDRPVKNLSLGQKMRCELVNTLLYNPELIFLDEPTIGLDVISKQKIRQTLKLLNSQGKTIMLTSHDTGDIENLCNRIVIINDGKVAVDNSIEEFRKIDDTKKIHITYSTALDQAEFANLKEHLADSILSLTKENDFELKAVCLKPNLSVTAQRLLAQGNVEDIKIYSEDIESLIADSFKQHKYD